MGSSSERITISEFMPKHFEMLVNTNMFDS